MKKLNKIYRANTKVGVNSATVHGVSLEQKIRLAHSLLDLPCPRNKKDRILSTLDILGAFNTDGKVKSGFEVKQRFFEEPNAARPVQNRTKPKSDFYQSWEWKAARFEAIKMHGQRCQCCGWQPGDTTSGRLVVDHIKPRSRFPSLALDVSNLQVLCNDCNMGKSNVHTDDFRGMDHWLNRIAQDG